MVEATIKANIIILISIFQSGFKLVSIRSGKTKQKIGL